MDSSIRATSPSYHNAQARLGQRAGVKSALTYVLVRAIGLICSQIRPRRLTSHNHGETPRSIDGVDVLLVARMAGRSVAMIERVYGHCRNESYQEAQAKLDQGRARRGL